MKADPIAREAWCAKRREKYWKNVDEERMRRKQGYQKHKTKYLAKAKETRDANLDAYNAERRAHRQKNLEKAREYDREYSRKRRQRDLQYRIVGNLRNRIRLALEQKSECTKDLLGCSIDDFIKHLQSLWREGMNWENYGSYWSIDHIQPCSSFDLTDPEQQKACFHYTNCQPLTVSENSRKGNRNKKTQKRSVLVSKN
jgi:hypothetical protein